MKCKHANCKVSLLPKTVNAPTGLVHFECPDCGEDSAIAAYLLGDAINFSFLPIRGSSGWDDAIVTTHGPTNQGREGTMTMTHAQIDEMRERQQIAPICEKVIETPHGRVTLTADNWKAIADIMDRLFTRNEEAS